MYLVKWLQEALDELMTTWLHADSALRQAITLAAHTLDQELQADPFRNSESREDEERVLFAYPLAIQFEVDQQNRLVWILHVWRFRRRVE